MADYGMNPIVLIEVAVRLRDHAKSHTTNVDAQTYAALLAGADLAEQVATDG